MTLKLSNPQLNTNIELIYLNYQFYYHPQTKFVKVMFLQLPGPRGVSAPRGRVCLVPRGCLVETPRMATAAGGMHPTGMHSCLFNLDLDPMTLVLKLDLDIVKTYGVLKMKLLPLMVQKL